MKNQEAIKRELEKVFNHRLNLRLERKNKNCCKNCTRGIVKEIDLGEFGKHHKFICSERREEVFPCSFFECAHNDAETREELIADIKDPAICNAKEPKIAALLWVLHEDGEPGILDRLKRFFK